MAYVQPESATFKARYPEFSAVSNDLITLVLNEAFDQIGECWLERDRARAQMLLAAHTLTVEGEPGRSTSGQGAAGTGTIKRRKVGDVEVEFNGFGSTASGGFNGFGSTAYGQQYLELLRRNFPAVAAV